MADLARDQPRTVIMARDAIPHPGPAGVQVMKGRRAVAVTLILVGCTGPHIGDRLSPTGAGTPSRSPTGTATADAAPIRHVVVIFQENHSFDNVLGLYCTKVAAGTIHRSGPNMPCDGVAGAPTMPGSPGPAPMSDVVPSIAHTVGSQRAAIDGGKMDGWLRIHGCTDGECLGQYAPGRSPNLVALAAAFTVADRTFEHSTSASWVGHIELVAASSDGFYGNNPVYRPGPGVPPRGPGWGCDSNDVAQYGPARPLTLEPSCIPDRSLPASTFPHGGAFRSTPANQIPTIMDRIERAGLTWKLYAGLGPGTNAKHGWEICPTFAACLYTPKVRNWLPNSMVLADARHGRLPSFSVVTPTSPQSQHNGDSWTAGDRWIGRVVSAIEQGPDWSSTAIFITWDDCGCFYDHVNPLGYEPTWGVRVPMVIVSPYAKAGFTDSGPTTFSGILAYTEHLFGLAPLTASDAGAYDFGDSFDYAQEPLGPVPMVDEVVPLSSRVWIAAHPPSETDPT